ncbi:ATP-binding protein [Agaribacterium haliotis]|uniref:ATP-binding protein n=1 Tax=Agaribacterium haliotis TaxID=2013869 RepID=UPI000BB52C10|nr:ATP-binding protein [Agaribacterium haliotis]
MSHFFQPCSKVQKDRHIMRETDARMAKYSRRGLIFNFIAFLVCLIGGKFVAENPVMTVVLSTGLLVVTLLRGFYLFRFEQLYPRGPARWRQSYFIVTLIGSIWWGLIMVSITLELGLGYETPLLWLYTVVFFSTTAHAFAPYHRFLSYYQFFGLMPAAAAAMIIGGLSGYIYGALMLMFYLILVHQCRLISDNYWEKLEAGYALGKRVVNDEQARITSKLNERLSREFFASMDKELCEHLSAPGQKNDTQKLIELQRTLSTFRAILARKLRIEPRIFNVRHEIQFLVSEFVQSAEAQGVQIETALSPNLPMRLKGDAKRFAEVVRSLIVQVLRDANDVALIVEVQFLREYERAGELHVNVRRMRSKDANKEPTSGGADSESLELVLAKGLANLMEGDIEQLNTPTYDYQLRFSCKLDIADNSGQVDFHKNRFNGKSILLVGSNPAIVDIKRQELDALGFQITTETQFRRVKNLLTDRVDSGRAIENILIYHEQDQADCLALLEALRDSDALKSVNKLIAASETRHKELKDLGFDEKLGFYFVSKPLGLFELESTFEYVYTGKGDMQAQPKCQTGNVILVGDESEVSRLREACQVVPGQQLKLASKDNLKKILLESDNPMVVIPCTRQKDIASLVDTIRYSESNKASEESFIPIVGLGINCSERDVDAFEAGFDDYLNLASTSSKTLTSMLRYWRSLEL